MRERVELTFECQNMLLKRFLFKGDGVRAGILGRGPWNVSSVFDKNLLERTLIVFIPQGGPYDSLFLCSVRRDTRLFVFM